MAALEAAAGHSPALEARLSEVETRLAALGNALRARDPVGIDLHAAELHRALASAVTKFSDAAKTGPLPPSLRHRLASASGQVAAQRESLTRHRRARPRDRCSPAWRQRAALFRSRQRRARNAQGRRDQRLSPKPPRYEAQSDIACSSTHRSAAARSSIGCPVVALPSKRTRQTPSRPSRTQML